MSGSLKYIQDFIQGLKNIKYKEHPERELKEVDAI